MLLLSPMRAKEAVLSSQIEGTATTTEEVFESDALGNLTVWNDDLKEVRNYRNAIVLAAETLQGRPLTLHLIRQVHRMLMDSARGREKNPGAFRTTQNFIRSGLPGIENARYIPPDPLVLNQYLENLEAYFSFDEVDPIVQVAVIHAQFEIIHPFEDGNGRVGRILIPLFLFARQLLESPSFYVSETLEEARDEYVDRLLDITTVGDWNGWIAFFLEVVSRQATRNVNRARRILSFYEESKRKFEEATHSQFAVRALDALMERPVVTVTKLAEVCEIEYQTARRILQTMAGAGLISERPGSGRRPAVYRFDALLEQIE